MACESLGAVNPNLLPVAPTNAAREQAGLGVLGVETVDTTCHSHAHTHTRPYDPFSTPTHSTHFSTPTHFPWAWLLLRPQLERAMPKRLDEARVLAAVAANVAL